MISWLDFRRKVLDQGLLIALKEELFLGRKSNRIVPTPSEKHNWIKEKKDSERKKYIVDQGLVEGNESLAAIRESNEIGIIENLDQIRLSDLMSNPPGTPENQLMVSPNFVKIEPLKILNVSALQQSDPVGSEDNVINPFLVNEMPINSPSADQNFRSAKTRKRSIPEVENMSETVPELRKRSVGSERVVEGGTMGKIWSG